MTENKRKHILILGAGFGGLYTALELEKLLSHSSVEVTLVNRENFFLFTPMLHEVAASDLDITHIVNPIRKLLRRTIFVEGSVESVDLTAKRVIVSHGTEHYHHEIKYDYLVLALGSVTNFYNLPGLEEHALTMKSLGDAIRLRNHLIKNLEEADFEVDADKRGALLNFVVAGGGFAGVETIAAINDFVREAIKFYPRLTESSLRMVLVELGPAILPELGDKLGAYAYEKLSMRKVEVILKAGVTEFSGNCLELSDSTRIKTNTLVWTAGISPHPILETLSCEKEKGRIVTNEFMEVTEFDGVWALGDCARIPDLTTGKACPPTAQHALRQGRIVARNIVAAIKDQQKKAFVFKTIGLMASIGRRAGVARIFGINFSGFIAWWLWRTIYLSKLPRFEKKLRVALDWTLDLLFSKDLVQFSTALAPTAARPASSSEQTTGSHAREMKIA
jgi:NADH dehydrogenase